MPNTTFLKLILKLILSSAALTLCVCAASAQNVTASINASNQKRNALPHGARQFNCGLDDRPAVTS